ncbi:hypothetical protein SERLA73DRAFT_169762 [Serpula lacrymans var. lacrymans S7.3]|uniref:F-box domain-containing protein n=2 Tax=Serpula lacrymans var. lacrymans TaxID=341189 RepID=F8Q2L7_SERL3|nr:uncharacterized protein SERLADRAFT_450706 [Serpula lacrymans var. lacrymans S7.9]EGN97428.1 hypothetical protein SERLA73DRAFT_169762 [Serpula lacrymans var. lacrymans S7.3]EGO23018.1 hypothetical protein SERLADRAFT_450706 [Serpula lacrymans var. lacrymans S7.9]
MNTLKLHPLSSFLPVETLDHIFRNLSREELCPVLLLNSFFHDAASRVLYRCIAELTAKQVIILVRTLSKSDIYPPLVRELIIGLEETRVTGNFFRLLHRALQRLNAVTSLTIEFSHFDNTRELTWIFDGCVFSLKSFTTSIRSDLSLANFLGMQPDITELCLRGFQSGQPFTLPTSALPKLKSFRAVHSGPCLLTEIIRGRPIEGVSLSLYGGDTFQSLDTLLLSTSTIRRLTIMSFDTDKPNILLPEVAARLPELEALHIVVLMAQYTLDVLREASPLLSRFRALRYLTFMAPGAPASVDEERSIAAQWHESCPTLKTIILPRGMVWFQREGKWTSWNDTEHPPILL